MGVYVCVVVVALGVVGVVGVGGVLCRTHSQLRQHNYKNSAQVRSTPCVCLLRWCCVDGVLMLMAGVEDRPQGKHKLQPGTDTEAVA